MSFRKNDAQQISFSDSLFGLTEREKKALEKSWAKVFADEIFPTIDEERFSVLYSDKDSRPNTPVNIIVGALVLKELFGLSDDDMVETLICNVFPNRRVFFPTEDQRRRAAVPGLDGAEISISC